MRLKSALVRNFKGISEVEIKFPAFDPKRPGSADFVTIIGENNAGKSSILDALLFALPETDKKAPGVEYFPARDAANGPIEVELLFDGLTTEDRQRPGIRTHVHNNEYRIRKSWSSPGQSKPIIEVWTPGFSVAALDGPETPKLSDLRALSPEWDVAVDSFLTATPGVSETRALSSQNRAALREIVVTGTCQQE